MLPISNYLLSYGKYSKENITFKLILKWKVLKWKLQVTMNIQVNTQVIEYISHARQDQVNVNIYVLWEVQGMLLETYNQIKMSCV